MLFIIYNDKKINAKFWQNCVYLTAETIEPDHKYETETTEADLIFAAQFKIYILENHNAMSAECPGGAYEISAPLPLFVRIYNHTRSICIYKK